MTASFVPVDPPRQFPVGRTGTIVLRDCGRLTLGADEQVTLVTPGGGEYDVVRKAWGFYATPSLNGRLPRFGLRAALVRSGDGKAYVMLVERGSERGYQSYCDREGLRVLTWLDTTDGVDALEQALGRRPSAVEPCLCGADAWETVFVYTAAPPGEVRFAFGATAPYRRTVYRCRHCRHFVSRHDLDASALYSGDYVTSTYGADGLRAAFDRINALPAVQSDNVGRVRRIQEFADVQLAGRPSHRSPTLLDVGSGLGVFVHRMKAAGWRCTALDPDPRAARHAREVVGVDACCAEFGQSPSIGPFDAVTFNKVLEHVREPVPMLARARRHLAPGGFVYVEVPDGEAAAAEGPGREEFFIDHYHVFSPASLALLAARAGFVLSALERLREPSGKYTLRAFLVAAERGEGS